VTGLRLTKTQGTQRRLSLGTRSGGLRTHWTTEERAVGVPSHESIRSTAFQQQSPPMHRPVVGSAQDHHLVWIVRAAFRPESNVMNVDKERAATTQHLAPAAVAMHHLPPDRWWDGLRRAHSITHVGIDDARLTHVGIGDALRVARCHLHHLGPYLHPLATSCDAPPVALRTHRHCHLIPGSTVVLGSLQHLPRHHHEHVIVIETATAVPPQLRLCFTEHRVGLRRDLHAKNVTARLRANRIIGGVARQMT